MSTLKAEQIVAAVASVITSAGIVANGSVLRASVYQYHDEVLPAINVIMGADRPVTETGPDNFTFQDWMLTVYADVVIKQTLATGNVDTELNSLRLGVHKAVMANYTLGLSFVINGYPSEVMEPERKGEGEEQVAVMRTAFTFHYRATITDPSQ